MSRECQALRLKGAGHRGDAGGFFGGNPWPQAALLLKIVMQQSTNLLKPGLLLGGLLAHGKGWEAGGGGSGAAAVQRCWRAGAGGCQRADSGPCGDAAALQCPPLLLQQAAHARGPRLSLRGAVWGTNEQQGPAQCASSTACRIAQLLAE